jgi:hypothetical protein
MDNNNMGMAYSINQRDESITYRILNTKTNGRHHLAGDLSVDRRIILH